MNTGITGTAMTGHDLTGVRRTIATTDRYADAEAIVDQMADDGTTGTS
jgi:hypothetical protein